MNPGRAALASALIVAGATSLVAFELHKGGWFILATAICWCCLVKVIERDLGREITEAAQKARSGRNSR